jgi:hypothetical protein
MKPGDLVRDLGTGDMGIITDTYVQPQLNQLFIKMLAAGRETGWIRAIDNIEPVQDPRDVVEWEHQSRRRNESVRGR